jgi:hypothetical protein
MSAPVNEALIRDVVAEVLGRLNRPGGTPAPATAAPPTPAPAPATAPSAASATPTNLVIKTAERTPLRGVFGVFQDARQACEAARRWCNW